MVRDAATSSIAGRGDHTPGNRVRRYDGEYLPSSSAASLREELDQVKSGVRRIEQEIDRVAPGSTGSTEHLDLFIESKGTALMTAGLGFMSALARGEAGRLATTYRNVLSTTGGFGTVHQAGSLMSCFGSQAAVTATTLLGGVAGGLNLYAGGRELLEGLETGNRHTLLNSALDLGLGATAIMVGLNPALAGAGLLGTAILLGVRFVHSLEQLLEEK